MQKRPLGKTGLHIAPVVFGGNVFGWTIDEQTSFSVLDAFLDHGFNAIDTADVYSAWAPGNRGGESETILGKWFAANPGKRDRVTLFTKVGSDMGEPGKKNLSARYIEQAVDASLRRLQTDHIDLYFSHWPDPTTPYAETLGAYEKLLKAGKIRNVGASNLDATQLADALAVSQSEGLPRYDVLQPEYNLVARDTFEGPLRDLCLREDIGVVTYFSLASGFLSGKYRSKDDFEKSKRGSGMEKYLNDRGFRILAALDDVSARHSASQAEVALAWLIASPGVTAPIASATSTKQVDSFAKAASLSLSAEDMAALNQAGA